jgi:hypothetical protein
MIARHKLATGLPAPWNVGVGQSSSSKFFGGWWQPGCQSRGERL